MESKPYLVFMAGPGSLKDIQELVEPVKQYFRGICTLLHDCDENSPETNYILKVNNELGGGNIIFGCYSGRHNHSRNRILYETGIQDGEYFVTLDVLETIPIEFAENIQKLIKDMEDNNIEIISYYYKPYIVKFSEDMFYMGTPHETLMAEHNVNTLEYSMIEKNESKVRVNTRPLKRDKNHFLDHYVRYLLLPNSNQNTLGLEHHGGAAVYPKLQNIRKLLLSELKKANLPRTTDGVKTLFAGPLNSNIKIIINEHGQLNNFYKYHIMRKDIIDDHSWKNLIKI